MGLSHCDTENFVSTCEYPIADENPWLLVPLAREYHKFSLFDWWLSVDGYQLFWLNVMSPKVVALRNFFEVTTIVLPHEYS